MSHRKVFSQGSIPFSWEDSPGISKAAINHHQDCPMVVSPVHSASLSPSSSVPSSMPPVSDVKNIPLPPCTKLEPPRRSISLKGFRWWQEDPFLAAYRECTKDVGNCKLPSERKKSNTAAAGSKLTRRSTTKFMFSCKNSWDVTEDNFVSLSNLPPIPRHRVRGR
ncbi:hypothetical protein Tsubulata_000882 [Turnera subulata]|uniref:Uncharacterized protein n=1 Tax=Turnera subulata TaxID=218843 RepID=A0A9Q0JIV7_9ROSI|nr:hypothetical protein Tsubulata_000882 [Turnera subulata]